MRQFQKIQNETENSIEQIVQGRTSKKRKTCNEEREQRIKNLVLRLKNSEINIIEFLRVISYNLSFYLTFTFINDLFILRHFIFLNLIFYTGDQRIINIIVKFMLFSFIDNFEHTTFRTENLSYT
jgi:hypothetical protein